LVSLSILPANHQALFVSCQIPGLNAKLADLGMIPGTIWKIVNQIPFSGPLVLSNGPIRISVRKEDADFIFMEENSK
jgi:Fe2+ transport system protein FeoA